MLTTQECTKMLRGFIHRRSVTNKEVVTNQPLFARLSAKIQGASQGITLLLDTEKKKNTITVLDGVRGLACFLVMFYHFNLVARDYHIWIPLHDFGTIAGSIALFGQFGVVLFFVLSGFLLFLPYAKSMLLAKDWPSVRLFYLRRAFRIMPAYYISLFLITLLCTQNTCRKRTWMICGYSLPSGWIFRKHSRRSMVRSGRWRLRSSFT